jgi:ATP-dependent DNA helicase DinG
MSPSVIASDIVHLLDGNCLLLFTSYSMLRDVHERMKDMIDHVVFSQDTLSSSDALQQYLDEPDSVLMGTHSFWQGIDLPGDALRGVIMMRLPFSVPDSPPMEAKIEKIKERGGNPFSMLQIPEAIIKFKQGFGRLIRSSSDIGIVAILDPRLINKSYGRLFLQSIPECRFVKSMEELRAEYKKIRGG